MVRKLRCHRLLEGSLVINRQFRSEWQDSLRHSHSGESNRVSARLTMRLSLQSGDVDTNSAANLANRHASFGWIVLLLLLVGCADLSRKRTPTYQEPNNVTASAIFAVGQGSHEVELQHLRNTRDAAGLLRRAWLELQVGQPQAALDTSAQILFGSDKPSANDESFARYIRAEAYRRQGNQERGKFDLDRARLLALDPELQRRLSKSPKPRSLAGPIWGKLPIMPRASWQPRPAVRNNLDVMQQPRRITIHHSAMYFRDTGQRAAAAQISRIQRDHMRNRSYGDIGYHFLIDPSGRIWEGRKMRYQGAHASGSNNIGNIGVCLLGNFVRQKQGQGPTSAQIESMEGLVMQMMQHYGFGGESLFCHSDFKNTACPGTRMQPIVRLFARQLKRNPRILATEEDDE